MEKVLVGNELQYVHNGIPFLKIGEGYIKRLCYKPIINSYHYRLDFEFDDIDYDKLRPELEDLQDFFGKEKGEFYYNFFTSDIGYFVIRRQLDASNLYHRYTFPKGRVYTIKAKDLFNESSYLSIDDKSDIDVQQGEDDKIHLLRMPLVYVKYDVEYRPKEEEILLSNDTIDIYRLSGNIQIYVKKFPISNVFEYCKQIFTLDLYDETAASITLNLNRLSLMEQVPTIFKYKCLQKVLMNYVENNPHKYNTDLITNWSKHFRITQGLKNALLEHPRKVTVASFLKEYIRCEDASVKRVLELGTKYLKDLLAKDKKNYEIINFHSFLATDIDTVREFIEHYNIEDYSGWYGIGNIIFNYSDYKRLRKMLSKTTPAFPELNKLSDYLDKFREEIKQIELSKPLDIKHEFEFVGEKYMMVHPKTGTDIVKEGQVLHHCVGTYVDRVREGKTNIIFMRKVEDPETPLYTVELDNKFNVIQARALQNKDLSEDAWKFLEFYVKEKQGKE